MQNPFAPIAMVLIAAGANGPVFWIGAETRQETAVLAAAATLSGPSSVLITLWAWSVLRAPHLLRGEALSHSAQLRSQLRELTATREAEQSDRANVEQQIMSLSQIAEEGRNLQECSHGTRRADPPFIDDYHEWRARTLEWIETSMGPARAARFKNVSGVAPPRGLFIDFLTEAQDLNAHLTRIAEFMAELSA